MLVELVVCLALYYRKGVFISNIRVLLSEGQQSNFSKFQVFCPIFQKKKFLFQNIYFIIIIIFFFFGGGGVATAPISPLLAKALFTPVTDSLSF